MGRYYNGDINGKFWFAVQSSSAADRFGVRYSEPNYIQYHFDEEDLEGVREELDKIEARVDLAKMDKFFEAHITYDNEMLAEAEITREELSEYADYKLGRKIEDCLVERGRCEFEAEL